MKVGDTVTLCVECERIARTVTFEGVLQHPADDPPPAAHLAIVPVRVAVVMRICGFCLERASDKLRAVQG